MKEITAFTSDWEIVVEALHRAASDARSYDITLSALATTAARYITRFAQERDDAKDRALATTAARYIARSAQERDDAQKQAPEKPE